MRRVARVGMVLAVLFAGIVLPGSAAQACSCAIGTPTQSANRADAVFFGEIVDRTRTPSEPQGSPWLTTNSSYTVAVERVFKGEVYAEQVLLAGGNGASCGIMLPASGSVLVYGTKAPGGEGSPMQYATWSCSGTEMTRSVPAALGEGDPPIGSSTSGYGSQLTITPDADKDTNALPIVVGAVTVALLAGLAVVAWRRRPN